MSKKNSKQQTLFEMQQTKPAAMKKKDEDEEMDEELTQEVLELMLEDQK